jgi:hypothetical protein
MARLRALMSHDVALNAPMVNVGQTHAFTLSFGLRRQ